MDITDEVAPYSVPVVRVQLVCERTITTDRIRIRTASDVFQILKEYMNGLDREVFMTLMLNTQNQLTKINTVSMGTLDASLVHPREVFKPAIVAGAASLILAHNHPSGDPTPSSEDRAVTRSLAKVGNDIAGIPIMDHVVIGEGWYVSFRETGLFPD